MEPRHPPVVSDNLPASVMRHENITALVPNFTFVKKKKKPLRAYIASIMEPIKVTAKRKKNTDTGVF